MSRPAPVGRSSTGPRHPTIGAAPHGVLPSMNTTIGMPASYNILNSRFDAAVTPAVFGMKYQLTLLTGRREPPFPWTSSAAMMLL